MPELPDELRQALENLPEEPERSKLDPFRSYILRWKTEGRSYRRIQSILEERCGVRISYGALREFVLRRSRPRKRADVETEPKDVKHKPLYGETKEAKPESGPKKPVFHYDESIPPVNKNFWRK
jgi:hypothetical protein